MIFEYDESGYVKDTEKATLDGDKILATLREGQESGNEERRRRGWEELTIGGWIRPPYYDEETNNLTWAIRGRSGDEKNDGSDDAINFSTRILGREGTMNVDLVVSPRSSRTPSRNSSR